MRFLSIILFGFLGLAACGGSTDTAEEEEEDSTSTNSLAVTFPDDLAVSSLTAATEGTTSLNALIRMQTTEDLVPQNFVEKKEEMATLLNPTAPTDIAFDIDFSKSPPDVGCYGPVVNLQGTHPDGNLVGIVGLPPFDTGLWTETEGDDDEACAAAQLNKLIGDIENYLNAGIKTGAATVGVAGLEETALPEAGETPRDLSAPVSEVMETNGIPIDITTATMAREASDVTTGEGTFPVFTTEITGAIEIPETDVSAATTAEFEVTFQHVPEVTEAELASISALRKQTADDDTYCGEMKQKIVRADEDVMNCGNAEGHTECIFISYCKDSDTSLTYHLRRGQFCGTSDCLDSSGVFASGADQFDNMDPDSSEDGWGGNFYHTVCTVNPENGSGSCAQAWQAGAQDALTRVLNVTVNADGTGCGYFGFGPEAGGEDDDTSVGEIDRMICNWAGPGGAISSQNYDGQPLAQRQCFERNETSGVFTSIGTDDDGDSVDESLAITYAPTVSCNKAANSFAYGEQSPPTDVAAATLITNDLIDTDEIIFTLPTLPAVPEL